MTACVYCHKSPGRRECPALGGLICSSCCGQHRGLDLDCPPQCKYFRAHEEYQRARWSSEYHQAWLAATEPFYLAKQWELLDFIVSLEAVIYRHFSQETRGSDRELIEALDYLERQLGLIAIIERPASELESYLKTEIQGSLERSGLEPDKAQRGIAAVRGVLSRLAEETDDRRRGLHGLLGHIEEHFQSLVEELGEQTGVIEVPHIFTPGERGFEQPGH
ncbi:MAG TPA: hypothetical protein ENI60_03000 [Candidatus Fraserbacteria bacterium]|nr:hypothetical protein [Candidatus Fraserbacteria bacterium]